MGRMRFQGVRNVVQFNWHFYLLAFLFATTLFIVGLLFRQPLLFIISGILVAQALISIVVSYVVYDRSRLYDLAWLDRLQIAEDADILNVHSGFDETSPGLTQKFPRSAIRVFDFYDEKKHTEVSIRRARRSAEQAAATKVTTTSLPVSDDSIDLCCVVFAAHEIRDDAERASFFRELRRSINLSGRIVVTEHLRDMPNLVAYNVGAYHFLPRSNWLATFGGADLRVLDEFKITPFVTTFVLGKDGTST
jgi:SAM-dependent methyltransferase